jgi:hypothetical protein
MAEGRVRGLPYATQRLPNLDVGDANDDVRASSWSQRTRTELALYASVPLIGVAVGALLAWSWL